LSDGEGEVSAFWIDKATQELCRCRPDWVSPVAYGTGSILVDVQTTQDASAREFSRSALKFGYHLQAAFYCEGYALASGLDVHGMVFAVVESEYPHACAAFMLSDHAMNRAREEMREALGVYAQCRTSGVWPGYPREIQTLDLPSWA
jgi:PDDEXK-like domain of unknown function (DUF3799)